MPGPGELPPNLAEPVLTNLDLADQVERGLQRFRARGPLRRAHFARMRSDVLGRLTLRNNSFASRPIPLSWTSMTLILPSGSITKVPRYARPCSSISTSKLRASVAVGSPTNGYCTFLMVSEVSCHALCAKCVSVDTPYTSTPSFLNSA